MIEQGFHADKSTRNALVRSNRHLKGGAEGLSAVQWALTLIMRACAAAGQTINMWFWLREARSCGVSPWEIEHNLSAVISATENLSYPHGHGLEGTGQDSSAMHKDVVVGRGNLVSSVEQSDADRGPERSDQEQLITVPWPSRLKSDASEGYDVGYVSDSDLISL